MARIRIEDLPALAHLTPEELEEIFGVGSQGARLGTELLEERQMLDAGLTTNLQGSLLQIQDTKAGDLIHVHQANNQISLDGISINTAQGSVASVSVGQVAHIDLSLLGGADQVNLGTQTLATQQALAPVVGIHPTSGGDTLGFTNGCRSC